MGISQVKSRWRLGLGKYLVSKLEIAMGKAGALEVDKIEGKAGNYVFMNAHSEGLAVRMTDYEAALSHLTSKLPNKKTAAKKETKVLLQSGRATRDLLAEVDLARNLMRPVRNEQN